MRSGRSSETPAIVRVRRRDLIARRRLRIQSQSRRAGSGVDRKGRRVRSVARGDDCRVLSLLNRNLEKACNVGTDRAANRRATIHTQRNSLAVRHIDARGAEINFDRLGLLPLRPDEAAPTKEQDTRNCWKPVS